MLEMVVGTDWLDELDHVSFLQHQRVADRATEILWRMAGGPPFTATSPAALVMIDVRARYARELRIVLERQGRIPFERILNSASLSRDGLSKIWFEEA